MKKKTLMVLIMIWLFLVMCSGPITLQKEINKTPSARESWVEKWIKSPGCLAPCWEGITPGKTNLSDVPALLETTDGFRQITRNKEILIGQDCIEWAMKGNDSGMAFGLACSDVSRNPEVQEVRLSFERNKGQNIFMRLSELVELYGEPEYVDIELGSFSCLIQLFFQKYGMTMTSGGDANMGFVEIGRDLPVGDILLIDSTIDTEKAMKKIGFSFDLGNFRKWEGYKDYKCR
jgi:hypothetical protein